MIDLEGAYLEAAGRCMNEIESASLDSVDSVGSARSLDFDRVEYFDLAATAADSQSEFDFELEVDLVVQNNPLLCSVVVAHHFVDISDSSEPVSACNFDFDSWCMMSNLLSAYS